MQLKYAATHATFCHVSPAPLSEMLFPRLKCTAAYLASGRILTTGHMPFVANEDLCCPICENAYATANSAFSLDCSEQGCRGHLCFDCLQKSCFPGNSAADKTCPHCRRAVKSYSYAFFAVQKQVTGLQDKLSAADAETSRLKKNLLIAKFDAQRAMERLDEWGAWATASKSALLAMPSSATLAVVLSPRARSRSPRRQVRPSGVMYAEYDG